MRRFYYGWVLVWTLAFTEMTSWGILYYTFSVTIAPVQREMGWNRADLTGAFSLALFVSGLAAIPIGRWMDRQGARVVMTTGSSIAVLLVLVWAQVQTLPALYVVWVGIGVTMAMVLYDPAFTVVAVWFRKHRAHALTILTFGGGLASVVYVPLAEYLIKLWGWRAAITALAVILGLATIPFHALFLRHRPMDGSADHSVNPHPFSEKPADTLQTVLMQRPFWIMTGAFSLANFAGSALIVHLIPYLTDLSMGTSFAAGAVGLIGITALPGRLIFTPLGNYLPRRKVTALLFGLQALSLIILLFAHSPASVLLFVCVFGAGYGAISPARAALIADVYGIQNYGSINGAMSFIVTLARAVAPITIGIIFVAAGSYLPALILLLIVSLIAGLLMFF